MTKRTRNCNSKNHLLVTIFAALLAVLVPQQLAAYDFMVDGLCYNRNDDGTSIAVTYENTSFPSYSNLSGDLTIPETVTYNGITYSVTAIGNDAFDGCSGLQNVSIPKSMRKIGARAFEGCSNLKKVDINDIQAWCQLEFDRRDYYEGTYTTHIVDDGITYEEIEIPYKGYKLSFSANPLYYAQHLYLNGVEVTNLSIPEGTTSISDIAFVNLTALQTVEFPNSLDFVGRHAFQGCKNLNKIFINSLESWSNITYSSFYTFNNSNCDWYDYDYGFEWPIISYTFYDNYANPLRYAHHLYLGNQEVKTVKINRTNLKYLTFSGGKFIETLIISDSVENIERNAFQDCSGLRFIKCYRNIPPSIDNPWNLPDDYYDNPPKGDDDASPFEGCELDSIVLQVPGKYISNYTNSEWSSVFKRISTLEDINIDGNVDIADVNAVLNVMMGRASNISQEDADVNGDGEVDFFDVNQIICVMLGNGTVPEPVPHKTYTVNGVSFTMVAVEGGTFTMGATPEQGSDAWDDEKPAHQVTLSGYSIGQTEVTQALWQAVMGSNSSRFTGDLQRPVERVSWNDCQTFINKLNQMTGLNFRLPTEAEWEYAARGGNRSQGYKYAGSNAIGDVAWYSSNSGSTTHPVATKAPNELGLYDMSGNVYEWCQDWYGSYSSDAQTNPTGPASDSDRVYRGGSWYGHAGYCRVSYRLSNTPSYSYSNLGLRLAL